MSERGYLETWTEVGRPEMFDRVIVAVDGARRLASEEGDHHYVSYIDNALLPFLEHEREEADRALGF